MTSEPPATEPTVRVGAVNYLNSKPLVFRLAERAAPARLLFDLPSRLADSLAAARLDVALVPSVEYLSNPNYRLISDACVASDGPVRSVKIYFRKAPDQVRRLALDEGSRTSAALGRILLKERYGLSPELAPLPIGCGAGEVDADAILLIGDRAMSSPAERFVEAWDLGAEWRTETGLPFVFACWAARPEAPIGSLGEVLAAARDDGENHLWEIAEEEAPKLGIDAAGAYEYLSGNLHYRIGPREKESLERFHNACRRLGVLPAATSP